MRDNGRDDKGVKPSGAGALGGMVVGGALGVPFGPLGVLMGGAIGAVVGNQIEYEQRRRPPDGRR